MNSPTLSLKNFSFYYSPAEAPTLAVDRLEIFQRDTVALVGRNGSGKSTLLLSLAGLLKPQKGQRITHVASEKIAFVFQTPCLDKKLTVEENLVLFGKIWGLKVSEIRAAMSALEPALRLEELLSRNVQSLSGGQQRRADLARALLLRPEILFLDEPTVGLDVVAQREFWTALAEAKKTQNNLTLICASHHAAELKLFSRFIFLESGHIVQDTDQKSLLEKLPPETLELTTVGSAEQLQKRIESVIQLKGTAIAHDKFIVQADDASALLEKIKNHDDLKLSTESVLVRKTQLSDAVYQRLIEYSQPFQNHDPRVFNGLGAPSAQ